MEPGMSFERQLAIALKENLTIETEFDDEDMRLDIKIFFAGEEVASRSEYFDHGHRISNAHF